MNKRAVIAMSGGVDSSVAAYLMKDKGYDCTGVTMKLFDTDVLCAGTGKPCGTQKNIEDARSVTAALGIPHHVAGLSADFEDKVVKRFVEGYLSGATPNPCIDCNRNIKFGRLLELINKFDCDYIVTGHYARVEKDAGSGRYLLKKALDVSKDQSYVLYSLTQEQLKHIIFPLGGLTKADTRAIAAGQGFISADKQDSQDICFIPDGDYAGFIERYTGRSAECGDFVDINGNVLGRHKGLIRYTIGQRRGLGLALPKPVYVQSKNVQDNTVTLCGNEGLFAKSLIAADFNWIAGNGIDAPVRVKAKIRYNHSEQPATATQVSPGTVRVDFDSPQRAIAKGQAAVLYDGDVVLGGGTIL